MELNTTMVYSPYISRSSCKPTVSEHITEKHFVGKRIVLYSNSTVSFRYRLLIAGDINPNPGPTINGNNSELVNSTNINQTVSQNTLPIT